MDTSTDFILPTMRDINFSDDAIREERESERILDMINLINEVGIEEEEDEEQEHEQDGKGDEDERCVLPTAAAVMADINHQQSKLANRILARIGQGLHDLVFDGELCLSQIIEDDLQLGRLPREFYPAILPMLYPRLKKQGFVIEAKLCQSNVSTGFHLTYRVSFQDSSSLVQESHQLKNNETPETEVDTHEVDDEVDDEFEDEEGESEESYDGSCDARDQGRDTNCRVM